MLPLFYSGLLSYLVGMKRGTNRHVECMRDNSHFVMYLFPFKPKSCAGHSSYTVSDNLMIFGRNMYQVKKECSMQEGQHLLPYYSSYLP